MRVRNQINITTIHNVKKLRVISLLALFLFLHNQIAPAQQVGQPLETTLQKSIQTPSVSSLGKFEDIPVNRYTGTPGISIPLFTLKTSFVDIPVSLRYHAAGIKVDEKAGIVGLGWSLNGGGVITRTMQSLPDDGYVIHPQGQQVDYLYSENINNAWLTLDALLSGNIPSQPNLSVDERNLTDLVNSTHVEESPLIGQSFDTKPDIFTFSFAGRSGKFILPENFNEKNTGTVALIPYKNVVAKWFKTSGLISKFEITDSDGTVYVFDKIETSVTKTVFFDTGSETWAPFEPNTEYGYRSSWFLTEIRSPVSEETVTLNYITHNKRIKSPASASLTQSEIWQTTFAASKTMTEFSGYLLKSITANREKLTIDYNNETLLSGSEGIRLSNKTVNSLSVHTRDSSPALIKKWKFTYDYFLSENDNQTSGSVLYEVPREAKLVSVGEIDASGDEIVPPYRFDYMNDANNELAMNYDVKWNDVDNWQQFFSNTAVDYWGFYNGKISNNGVGSGSKRMRIPDIGLRTNNTYDWAFKNLNPDFNYIDNGIIKSITYPAGGRTEFEFEIHDFSWVGNKNLNNVILDKDLDLSGGSDGGISSQWVQVTNSNTATFTLENIDNGNHVSFGYELVAKPSVESRVQMEVVLKKIGSSSAALSFNFINCGPWQDDNDPDTDPHCNFNSFVSENGYSGASESTTATLSAGTYQMYVAAYDLEVGPSGADPFQQYDLRLNASYQVPDTQTGTIQPIGEILTSTPDKQEIINDLGIIKTRNLADRFQFRNDIGGGLRIKKISRYDHTGDSQPEVRKFMYKEGDGNGTLSDRSSGVLVSPPDYLKAAYVVVDTQGNTALVQRFSSNSYLPLGTTHGPVVAYREVTEIIETGEGPAKIRHVFLSPVEVPDYLAFKFGQVNGLYNSVRITQDWARGKEIKTQYFNAQNQILSETTRSFDLKLQKNLAFLFPGAGMRKIQTVLPFECTTSSVCSEIKKFTYTDIEINTVGWLNMVSEKTEIFEGNTANPFNTSTHLSYYYGNNNSISLPRTIKEANSDGQQRTTQIVYAHEQYPGMPGANMFSQRYRMTVKQGSAVKNRTWRVWSNSDGYWRPRAEWVWRGSGLGDTTADPDPGGGETLKVLSFDNYDQYGNLLRATDANGLINEFFYGTNGSPFSQSSTGINGTDGVYLTGIKRYKSGLTTLSQSATYNERGLVATITDENGEISEFGYDGSNRLGLVAGPDKVATTQHSYSFSAKRNEVYNSSDPNFIEQVNYTNDSGHSDFTSSAGWNVVGDITFNQTIAGHKAVRMGTDGGWDSIYKSAGDGDIVARVDFYADNTTEGLPHVVSFDGSGHRFGVQYIPNSDRFRIQYRFSGNSFKYPYYFNLPATPNRWYTVEIVKTSQGEAKAWVYLKGSGRNYSDMYSMNGFPNDWIANVRSWSNDDYFYLADHYVGSYQQQRTYLDGLGREIQTQAYAGDGRTIISGVSYDGAGRQAVQGLPIERNGSPGFQSDYFNGFSGSGPLPDNSGLQNYYDTVHGQTVNDANFAYRYTRFEDSPLERPAKTTLPGYSFRLGGGNETVYSYSTKFPYAKTVITDPENEKTITLADGWGNQVRSVVDMNGDGTEDSGDLITRFSYDVLGNLVESVNPKGQKTTYRYDPRSLLTSKTTPDLDGDGDGNANEVTETDIEYRYDKQGNLRFIRDPNRRGQGKFIFQKYDAYGRLTRVGIYHGSSGDFTRAHAENPAWPTSNYSSFVIYTYDSGSFSGADNLKGRLAKVQYKEFSTGQWGFTRYSYNEQRLVKEIRQDIYGLPEKKIKYEYDNLGNITKLSYQPGASDAAYFWYRYDGTGRLGEVWSNSTNNLTTASLEADYVYWPDGQVKQLNLGEGAQSIDYAHNVRGWVDAINNPDGFGESTSGFPNDRFGIAYTYNLDGNIKTMDWEVDNNLIGFSDEPRYLFSYDPAKRLIGANYSNSQHSDDNSNGLDVPDIDYDKNGNIADITRYRNGGSGGSQFYDLEYEGSTNRLSRVVLNGSVNTISHDRNGNITRHDLRGISGTGYDWRNLPSSFTVNGQTLAFAYDGDGQRVKKDLNGGTTMYYVRGADGQTIAVYSGGTLLFHNILAGGQIIGKINP